MAAHDICEVHRSLQNIGPQNGSTFMSSIWHQVFGGSSEILENLWTPNK